MIAARAAADFSVRTFMAAEASFMAMIAPRLEMIGADGARFGQACMSIRCWRLFEKTLVNVLQCRPYGGLSVSLELSTDGACMADEATPAASGVRVASTATGAPTIEFLDDQGRAFAIAEFTPDVFGHLIGECCDLLEMVSKGGLATVACKGSA